VKEQRLRELLDGMRKARILVLGDYYLDAYWFIDKTKSKLSLETPWHINPVVGQRYQPGASGTIVNNLLALGVGTVHTLGVVGDDAFGSMLLDQMRQRGAAVELMLPSSARLTPVYLKPIHQGYGDTEAEGPRFDIENTTPLSDAEARELLARLDRTAPECDAVIFNDHDDGKDCGVISARVLAELNKVPARFPKTPFLADSRRRIGEFRNVIIKPNRFEAKQAVEPGWHGGEVDADEAKRCGELLRQRNGKPVITTLGGNGLLVQTDDGCRHIPAVRVQGPIDIVGAGDSVLAGITAALCAGASIVEAAEVGNLVASITITKLRDTGTASPQELLERCAAQAKR
jgi:rfaE bifunctional protein kinase chain/domain